MDDADTTSIRLIHMLPFTFILFAVFEAHIFQAWNLTDISKTVGL